MMSRLGITKLQRRDIIRAANLTCEGCGIVGTEHYYPRSRSYTYHTAIPHVYLSIDHIVARKNGGSDDPTNLHCLCTRCNSKKGARCIER